MNSFLSGFFNPLTCHALFAEKVHPSRDALVRVRSAFGNNAANLVTLVPQHALFLMIQHKFLGPGVEEEVQHRRQGNEVTRCENDVERENIAQHTVDHGRNCGSADRSRLDEAQDRAPVILRQRQHQRCAEDGVAGAVGDGSKRCPNA